MVHLYEMNGYRIAVDAGSGNIHILDEPAYEALGYIIREGGRKGLPEFMLNSFPHLSDQDINETLSDIDELVKEGKLFQADPYEGIYKNISGGINSRKPVLKALCLLVAKDCNLNCSYCFASQGDFGKDASTKRMSFETGKKAIDFLVESSGSRRNLEVDFFGGEPLLNFELCKYVVDYSRSIEENYGKNFRFTLTTNGVGINDEVIDWANENCYNVVLSLDGRKEVNDRFRVDRAGQGSYDRIVPLFQRFVNKRGGKNYYIRGTYTHFNTDFTEDIFHMADELDFRELSMEPVVADASCDYALREEDLPVLFSQYERLSADMLRRIEEGRPITFYHFMLDLEEGPCIYKRISGCGVGTEYLTVTADGELYPCHQFVSDTEYCLGDVWSGIRKPEVQEKFRDLNIYTRPACYECWARLYCAGGCSANALHSSGSLNGVYELGCALFRKRLECAIMLRAAGFIKERKMN